jgi:hypothetical protein
MDFVYYLAEALREHSPGAVATALEEKGCYGYDRFGRLVHLTGKGVEIVLSLVSEFYVTEIKWRKDYRNFDPDTNTYDLSPMQSAVDSPNDSGYWSYGWITGSGIPNFSDSTPINKSSILEKPLETKERDNLYRMLIAMAIDGYGYDITAKTSEIPRLLESTFKERFNFQYTAESISKHLRAAKKLIEITNEP